MKRKKFLKSGILGLGVLTTGSTLITACSKDADLPEDSVIPIDSNDTGGSNSTDSTDDTSNTDGTNDSSGSGGSDNTTDSCELSPNETAGPFKIKSPADLVRENIIGDRKGVALLINLIVQKAGNNCKPLGNVFVDLWHCDSKGYYSQYGGVSLQPEDFTQENFLRGRQTTNSNGEVSFLSIFPGWYPGRSPHIHLEILDTNEESILVTQIAFPKDICDSVYISDDYEGEADTLNSRDGVFKDGISGNLPDSLTGNNTDGYTLTKVIVV
jgi:protocatechuate 3,4-dioxygenase beta subunit